MRIYRFKLISSLFWRSNFSMWRIYMISMHKRCLRELMMWEISWDIIINLIKCCWHVSMLVRHVMIYLLLRYRSMKSILLRLCSFRCNKGFLWLSSRVWFQSSRFFCFVYHLLELSNSLWGKFTLLDQICSYRNLLFL